jgi:hypothetical protein
MRHVTIAALCGGIAFTVILAGTDQYAYRTSDHMAHAGFALSGRLPTYPLWHWTFLSLSWLPVRVAVALTGSLAFAATAWLTARATSHSGSATLGLTLALMFAYPFPNWWQGRDVYTWLVSPNFWHNPTANFSLPFALASFFVGARAIDEKGRDWRTLAGLSTLLALGVMAKPNWFLAFAVPLGAVFASAVTPLTAHKFLRLALVFAPATVLFWRQAHAISDEGAGVLFAPFELWQHYCPCIPAAIVLGLVFPLTVACLYPRQANADTMLSLAWFAQFTGIAQFALLMETGSRWGDGNMGWGMLIAAHVLFVASAAFVVKQADGWRKRLSLTVLVGHAVSGLVYLPWAFNLRNVLAG